MPFTTLAHLIDEEFLREAFGQIRKKAAAGVDGVKAEDFVIGWAGDTAADQSRESGSLGIIGPFSRCPGPTSPMLSDL